VAGNQGTVFYDLYTYSKNNLLDVGEWSHIETSGLSPLRSDHGAERRLDTFETSGGQQPRSRRL